MVSVLTFLTKKRMLGLCVPFWCNYYHLFYLVLMNLFQDPNYQAKSDEGVYKERFGSNIAALHLLLYCLGLASLLYTESCWHNLYGNWSSVVYPIFLLTLWKIFDAVFSLRIPWHCETANLVLRSLFLVNIPKQSPSHEIEDNTKLICLFPKFLGCEYPYFQEI